MKLKNMTLEELKKESEVIRSELIDAVSSCGGHLGSNLGIVELTMALHYVLESPKDVILFDVGHQSYVHKILTGRRHKMNTLRTFGGLSPFLDTSESEHDLYTTGHAGNIISAASGIAIANPERKVVAIIGDASLSNGEALEAINSLNGKVPNLFIIINDNEMSIGENVGGLFKYLNGILHNKSYNSLKRNTKKILEHGAIGSKLSSLAGRFENSVKYFLSPGNLFVELGYEYIGPVEGHDLETLLKLFKELFSNIQPQTTMIHIKTTKGKGYAPAELEKEKYHGVSPFDVENGQPLASKTMSFSEVFGETMFNIGVKNDKVVAISAAMVKGVGLSKFFEKFPTRSFDVGIAEMHAVTFAGGLAVGGKKPVVSIYSTFMQRAYDQLIHDISIQKLPVTIVMDRAGIVGEDGKTHQGLFDISFFRTVPNFKIFAPTCANEIPLIMNYALNIANEPIAIRISKSNAYTIEEITDFFPGKWNVLNHGDKVLILATGVSVKEVLDVKEQLSSRDINPTIVAVSSIKPLDEAFILSELSKYERVITIEENIKTGGFGSSILEFLNEQKISKHIEMIAVNDCFIPHGSRSRLLKEYGFSGSRLIESICKE
ncbi:MAG: 1-deoxy-D-xylulose-5-phosphate synthase [Fusobacteria bacterium]|nr:1-deoxy-D-xylulose-5-phosphate synthase [Fusobacteriota bacterium]